MLLIADLLIFFSLIVIVFQDFKQRQISWFLIPLALTGVLIRSMTSENNNLNNFLFNITFISVQLVLLTIYFSIKNKKFLNIIDTCLGLGDVLFFVVVSAFFSPLNFIVFYVCSMILTLTGIIVYNLLSKKRTKDIPLAGAMAVVLIVLLTTTLVFPHIDFYNDTYLLTKLQGS